MRIFLHSLLFFFVLFYITEIIHILRFQRFLLSSLPFYLFIFQLDLQFVQYSGGELSLELVIVDLVFVEERFVLGPSTQRVTRHWDTCYTEKYFVRNIGNIVITISHMHSSRWGRCTVSSSRHTVQQSLVHWFTLCDVIIDTLTEQDIETVNVVQKGGQLILTDRLLRCVNIVQDDVVVDDTVTVLIGTYVGLHMFILGQHEQQIGLNAMNSLHQLFVLPVRGPWVRYQICCSRWHRYFLLRLVNSDHVEQTFQTGKLFCVNSARSVY
uniref:Uncharacterized protein n=1 Tax=Cacopsylla melanoneura TaxID=428564 RepID=A0A8D8M7Y6_9HEMI